MRFAFKPTIPWKPRDYIGALVIIMAFISMLLGINSTMSIITTMVVTFYFTKKSDM